MTRNEEYKSLRHYSPYSKPEYSISTPTFSVWIALALKSKATNVQV